MRVSIAAWQSKHAATGGLSPGGRPAACLPACRPACLPACPPARLPAADNAAVHNPHTIAVIDFETTGMSPAQGARATEIAAVLVRDGRIVGRFASLMRSGAWVPPFIQQLTGISNRMLAGAPPAAEVMREVAAFTRGCGVVAHNASFDAAFWRHEQALAGDLPADGSAKAMPGVVPEVTAGVMPGVTAGMTAGVSAEVTAEVMPGPAAPRAASDFACTLLLSRRLYPEAPNHRLGTLAAFHGITATGRAHRALADAEVTAELWLRITHDVRCRYAASTPFGLLCALQRTPRAALARCAERYFAAGAASAR